MQLYFLLVALTLFDENVHSALLQNSTSFKIEMFISRSHVLLETLITEGCPSSINNQHNFRNPDVSLEAEMERYERLSDELLACRAAIKQNNHINGYHNANGHPVTTP